MEVLISDGLSHFSQPFAGSHLSLGPLVLAAYSAVFAYGGYDVLTAGLGDIKNPRRLIFFLGSHIKTSARALGYLENGWNG